MIAGLSALFSGCYTLKQGCAFLGYLHQAVPLDSLPADDFTRQVEDIRKFAEGLGLNADKNYTSYVTIDRDYLAAVVSACAKDSFKPYRWWFPVVGSVPYKGFFKVADAKAERDKLEKKGLDVWVRGVDAFSTLGWFKDPLFSYMRKYPVHELADTIIHESLHATVYLNGKSDFDEQLAQFVGSEGSRLYVAQKYGEDSPEYRAIGAGKADSRAFVAFIQGLIARLDKVYQSDMPEQQKLEQKASIIKAAQEEFDKTYDSNFKSSAYKGFAKLPINNAYLCLYRLYYEKDTFFEDLYDKSGHDLKKFIAAAKTLRNKGDPRAQLAKAISGNASS
jgi:predicted aminopeptidase